MGKIGLLLPVSSLPGKHYIGDFGSEAYKLIDILHNNHVELWQILPLNPLGYGNSPYQPHSSYAIDEIFISLDDLFSKGLIEEVKTSTSEEKVDYYKSREIKEKAITEAFNKYTLIKDNYLIIDAFLINNQYVDEYCKFVTLKELNDNKSWDKWTINIDYKSKDYLYRYYRHAFAQMMLKEEWSNIRKYAHDNNVMIIGDIPIYVGYDSSDVYFHTKAFLLDENYNPTCVAGVPPDFFSKEGQRWGNPIYDWDYMEKNNYREMISRIYYASTLYDIVRIDHFRAFDSYWAINPECETAVDGEWRYPNGHNFFKTLFKMYPNLNLIVEDLGDLRKEVLQLRDDFNLPGIRVSEFAIFEDEIQNKHIEKENQTYYTSTHDNETYNEWLENMPLKEHKQLEETLTKLKITGKSLYEKLINYALNRKEKYIIINITDLLNLDRKYRINKPGTVDNDNWTLKIRDFKGLENRLKNFLK